MKSLPQTPLLYLNAFVIGFVVMGFEMVASRYLFPYYGSGVTTWGALIATVLTALMAGYYLGGVLADRSPRLATLGAVVLAGAAFLALMPLIAGPALTWLVSVVRSDAWGGLLAAMMLTFIPIFLLGTFTPYAVRLALISRETAGRTAGRIYALSTLGNIVGTLATTFAFIPMAGSRAITFGFAVLLLASGLSLIWGRRFDGGQVAGSGTAVLLLALVLDATAGVAGPDRVIDGAASYPEGPLWRAGRLYYAEMGEDRISVWDGQESRSFFSEPGCGPTSIAPYDGGFLVLCHLADKLVTIDQSGRRKGEIARDRNGAPFVNPNDSFADALGGVYFSASGHFARWAPKEGAVYYLDAAGSLRRVAAGLRYSNGVLVDGSRLLVSEHLARRVVAYDIAADGSLGPGRVYLDLTALAGRLARSYDLSGPDGLERDGAGNLYVADYGEGRILVFGRDRSFKGILPVATPYVTNLALKGNAAMAVTGADDNATRPFPGQVILLDDLAPRPAR